MKPAAPPKAHPRVPKRIAALGLERRWGGFMGAIQPPYKDLDPFIFLAYHDHHFRPKERSGFPPQYATYFTPHRGFETVTYCVQGGFDHADSMGNKGRYGDGDVQWMRAGKGVLHAEMFVTEQDKNSSFLGFQLWLNLPQRLKMSEPQYQMLWKKDIPVVEEDGAQIRIIAGEYGGKAANVTPNTPLAYYHVTLGAGKHFSVSVPPDHNAFLFNFKGAPLMVPSDNSKIPLHSWAGKVRNDGTESSDFVFLHGRPYNEPMTHRGPFVMSNQIELMQAFQDYANGQFGEVLGWKSGDDDSDED